MLDICLTDMTSKGRFALNICYMSRFPAIFVTIRQRGVNRGHTSFILTSRVRQHWLNLDGVIDRQPISFERLTPRAGGNLVVGRPGVAQVA